MLDVGIGKAPIAGREKLVLWALASFFGRNNELRPSIALLAFRAGLGSTATRQALKKLESGGWIRKLVQSKGGRSAYGTAYTNRWEFNLQKLSVIANTPNRPHPQGVLAPPGDLCANPGSEPNPERVSKTERFAPRETNASARECNPSSGGSNASHREAKDNHQSTKKETNQQRHGATPCPTIPSRAAVQDSRKDGESFQSHDGMMANSASAIRSILQKYRIAGPNLETLSSELPAFDVSAQEVEGIAKRICDDPTVRNKPGALVRVLQRRVGIEPRGKGAAHIDAGVAACARQIELLRLNRGST